MLQSLTPTEAIELRIKEKQVVGITEESLKELLQKSAVAIGAFDLDTILSGKLLMFAVEEEKKPTKKKEKPSVEELYKADKSMEEIAEILDMSLADVSRVIDRLGLGKEKYKGKRIPDKGPAPIKGCIVGR